jgi:hypothetical protein
VNDETLFDVLADRFARDVDRTLLERSLKRTVTERIRWLEAMQEFAEQAKKARAHEAPGSPANAD